MATREERYEHYKEVFIDFPYEFDNYRHVEDNFIATEPNDGELPKNSRILSVIAADAVVTEFFHMMRLALVINSRPPFQVGPIPIFPDPDSAEQPLLLDAPQDFFGGEYP